MSANLIIPQVSNETDKLDTVVLGLPQSLGPDPLLSEAYDAKSYESIEKGIYPSAVSVEHEMGALLQALESKILVILSVFRSMYIPKVAMLYSTMIFFLWAVICSQIIRASRWHGLISMP